MSHQIADYHILFDGGSKHNGSPNQHGYGSYLLVTADGKKRLSHRQFGNMTNNEAEYTALIFALKDLIKTINLANRTPSDFSVRIVGDSALVLNQITDTWRCRALNLIPLKTQVINLTHAFKSVTTEHTPRTTSVRLLGH